MRLESPVTEVPVGLGWPDRLPVHWTVERVSNRARISIGWTPPTSDDSNFDGDSLWANISDLGERYVSDTAKRVSDDAIHVARARPAPAGSLLFSFKLSVGAVSFPTVPMYTNEAIASFTPRRELEMRYAYYAFPIYILRNAGENIYGAPILNQTRLAQAKVAFPPIEEQRAIAAYLDRETAQIDAFITKNEELIALLTERRGAVIARAVLRGLNASAELRDSGVTWLGEVPSHWRVSRLSRWFEVTLGKMLDEAKFAGTVGDVLPYVRASNIKAERLDLSDVNSMPFTPSEQAKFSLRSGDLVVVEGGSIGVNAPIEEDMHGWGFQKTVNRVRAIRGDFTRFLGYQIDVIREAGVLNMITNVSTIQHLTAEKLERIVVAMPPAEEQEAIVSHVRRATSAIDRAVETAEEGVRLARERRAALISAAVTGRIDVGVAV